MPGYPSDPFASQLPQALLGPWGAASLAISQAQVALKLGVNDATTGTNQNTDIQAPFAGSIVGIYYQLNTNKTAGALSVSPTINGTEIASTVPLYRTAMGNTIRKASKAADGGTPGLRFNAGDFLGAKVTTDGSFAPAGSADLHVYLVVVFEQVQP